MCARKICAVIVKTVFERYGHMTLKIVRNYEKDLSRFNKTSLDIGFLQECKLFHIFPTCQVFHCNLPLYLSDEIERIQRRALRIIFPACSYSEGLVKAGPPSLYDRRSQLCKELFSNIEQGDHKLSHLLQARSRRNYHLRSNRKFVVPDCKTNRYRDSFIISYCT